METTLPVLNEKLIYKVVGHIKADLRRLEMSKWGRRYQPGHIPLGLEDKYPPCGTQACFAGWTALLTTPLGKYQEVLFPTYDEPYGGLEDVEDLAKERLGLTDREASKLFYTGVHCVDKQDQYNAVIEALKEIFQRRGLEFKEPE